ncbi:MAG: flavodoxin domain-containing protein [Candidatus Hodarchaeales archaeon]|jgi:menaquinone-dependent protoporphyrinogen oxidase
MMTKRVLIAYGTRFGSTEEISSKFVEIMRNQGLDTTVINVKKDKWPPLDQFDAVLVGSGIKMGRWTKEAKNFFKKNVKALKEKSFFAVFVSSGEASYPEKYQEAKEKYVQKIITDLGFDLNKVMHEAFGGLFDLSNTSKIGWLEKKFTNMAARDDESSNLTENEYNDLRDWDQIQAFANKATTRILQL